VRSPGRRGRRIVANVGWRALADVGSKLASLALYVVMARELGASQFGIYMYGFALVTIVTALGSFGQGTILTREVARDRSRVQEYFGNTLALRALMSVPVVVLTILLTAATSSDRTTVLVVALLGAALVVELQTMTCTATYQAFERLSLVPIVLIGQRLFTAVVGIAVLLQGGDVVAVAAVYLASSTLAAVLAFSLLARYVWRPRIEINSSQWRALLAAAVPVGLAGTFGTIIFQAGTTMLGWLESDAAVGNYGAAHRLLQATFFVGWAVGAAVYPVMAGLGRETDPTVSFVYERAVKLALALSLPLAVAAGLLAEPAVSLVYGDEFADASDALLLLSPVIALYAVNHLSMMLLVSQHRQLRVAAIYGVASAAAVVGNLALIPLLSVEGAALTLTASELLLTLVFLLVARVEIGVRTWQRVAGPVVAAAAAGAAILLFRDEPAAALAAGALVYVAVLASFELLVFPEDARFFIGLARARRG
jgi:O-antigen/teichoic acid export membrane protein